MKLESYYHVIEIWKAGSISKAAQNLYLSQPNLSSDIRALELEVGFDIFKRKNTGVELTEEGKLFVKSAQRIINEVENIKNIPYMFTKYKNLSVSCTNSAFFMKTFMAFKDKYKVGDTEDYFKETGLRQTIMDVAEERYRLSVFYCFEERKQHYKEMVQQYNLEMIPLCEGIGVEMIVSSNSPLLKEGTIPFSRIVDYNFVTYEDFPFEDWLKVLGFKDGRNITYIYDRGGIVDTIRQGGYIAVVMKGGIQTGKGTGCAALPISGLISPLQVYLLKQKSYRLSPREYRFVKDMKEKLKTLK